MFRMLMFVCFTLGMCGCGATGFDRVALQGSIRSNGLQVNDEAIAKAHAARPQLQFPCKVAIYLDPASERNWHWSEQDRKNMQPWVDTLRKEGVVSDAFILPNMLVERTGKENVSEFDIVRLQAAKCGADAVFVIKGASEVDSHLNPAAVLNLTIVGGFVVPASHRNALFVMEGCLVDTNNGFIYSGVQSEGEGGVVRPTFLVEDRDAIAKAKTKAIANFGPELLTRMRVLSTAPINPARKEVAMVAKSAVLAADRDGTTLTKR